MLLLSNLSQALHYRISNNILILCTRSPVSQLPPRKTPFLERREREFLYLEEIDALIAATQNTRTSLRNKAITLLLFCQAL